MAEALKPQNNNSKKIPTYEELQEELAKVKPDQKLDKLWDAKRMSEERSKSCSV